MGSISVLAAIASGAAAVGSCYRRDMRVVHARLDALNSQIIETDAGLIEYAQ